MPKSTANGRLRCALAGRSPARKAESGNMAFWPCIRDDQSTGRGGLMAQGTAPPLTSCPFSAQLPLKSTAGNGIADAPLVGWPDACSWQRCHPRIGIRTGKAGSSLRADAGRRRGAGDDLIDGCAGMRVRAGVRPDMTGQCRGERRVQRCLRGQYRPLSLSVNDEDKIERDIQPAGPVLRRTYRF